MNNRIRVVITTRFNRISRENIALILNRLIRRDIIKVMLILPINLDSSKIIIKEFMQMSLTKIKDINLLESSSLNHIILLTLLTNQNYI